MSLEFFVRTQPKWKQPQEENQDSYFITNENGFFVLADGMGGAKCGAYASNFAVNLVKKEISSNLDKIRSASEEDAVEIISSIVKQANSELFKRGEELKECRGLGTTLDLGILKDELLYLSHVGDAGVFSYDNNGVLKKLTKDDTYVEFLIEKGVANPEARYLSSDVDYLTSHIGKTKEITANTFSVKLENVKYIFAASDGIIKYALPEELESAFKSAEAPNGILSKIFEIVSAPKGLAELHSKSGGRKGEETIIKLANRDDATGIIAKLTVR